MGVSALARRAAPANRARITGSLRSRRWPSAPPWRRPPTTSAALLRTLSSLGQPEVAGHLNGRAGQAASRLFPQRSEHVRPRVYESYTRGRTCPPSTAESRSFFSAPPELSATGPRGADRQVRRMGRERDARNLRMATGQRIGRAEPDARRAIDHRTGSATTTQERRGRAVVAQRR